MVSVKVLVGYRMVELENVPANHNSLKLEALHAPEHAVWFESMVKPPLQLLHMAAPCFVQAAPVLGEPFGQLHLFAAQDNMGMG